MKITSLVAAMPNYDFGLSAVTKIIYSTLEELEVKVDEINLGLMQIPYYDGITAITCENIINTLKQSNGIILASTATNYGSNAIIQTFIEHISQKDGEDIFKGKNCLIVTVSKTMGERLSLDYFSRVVNGFEGFDTVKIGLNQAQLKDENQMETIKEIIEKQAEDYYRMLRQNRTFIIPKDANLGQSKNEFSSTQKELLSSIEKKQKMPVSEIYQKLDLDNFTQKQEEDIKELTKFFAKKASELGEVKKPKALNQQFTTGEIKPRLKTCKQLTQGLPHYFQPQLANGLTAVIQISIGGLEPFDGIIIITNTECDYIDGVHESPDITLLSDDKVWTDIIKGKRTAQKAFMIGQLKVRGNFSLLAKFEQLFKPIP